MDYSLIFTQLLYTYKTIFCICKYQNGGWGMKVFEDYTDLCPLHSWQLRNLGNLNPIIAEIQKIIQGARFYAIEKIRF